MRDRTDDEFEEVCTKLIERRRGVSAVVQLLHDPLARFPKTFNVRMAGVHAEFIRAAYLNPLIVLVGMVNDGTVTTFAGFLSMMERVVAVTARHFSVKSYWMDHPRVRADGKDRGPVGERMPLFVRGGIDLSRHPDPRAGRAGSVDEDSWIGRVRPVLRGLSRLHRRAFWEAVRYLAGHGTAYGLFKAVAELAESAEGRVVGIRHGRHGVRRPASPATRRQVRRVLHDILGRLEGD